MPVNQRFLTNRFNVQGQKVMNMETVSNDMELRSVGRVDMKYTSLDCILLYSIV